MCDKQENPPLKYGVKACRWSVLRKHFSQKTAISERMASMTLRMFCSLSSSRRWTSVCNWGGQINIKQHSSHRTGTHSCPQRTGNIIFSPRPNSSSWTWPCVGWRPPSPPVEPAVCPTAAGSSLCDSHTWPRSLPCVPQAARSTQHQLATQQVGLRWRLMQKRKRFCSPGKEAVWVT